MTMWIQQLWQQLITLLTRRVLAMLTLLFCLFVCVTLISMSQLSTTLVRTQATQNAAFTIESIQKARSLYSSEVVNRLADQPDLKVTHDYLSFANAIPLPVTFLQELSRQMREENPEMLIRLYSDYPFPWHKKEGGTKDSFELRALQSLRQKPHQPYISFEDYQGRQVLRYAEADIMQPSCVACHNTHPNSPKKDWVVGDVRGALEVIQPLDSLKAKSQPILGSTFLLLGGLSGIGITALTVAIRRLRRQSQELEVAKDQLEAVINAVPGSISWINNSGTYLGVNRYFAKSWQLEQEDFIGRMVGFLQGSRQFAEFTEQFLASEDCMARQIIELYMQGQFRYYLTAAQKYQYGQTIVLVGIDITEYKNAQDALQIAEEKYRSIFENALEGIFQSSPEGRFLNVNPALAKIYGYDTCEEMLAAITDIASQLYVDPEKRQEFEAPLQTQGWIKNFESRCYRKDSSMIWVEIDARAVRDPKGNLLYYEGIVRDISERKHREAQLRKQLAELNIDIDQNKRENEVAMLTASSYFQEVQQEIAQVNLDEFWS